MLETWVACDTDGSTWTVVERGNSILKRMLIFWNLVSFSFRKKTTKIDILCERKWCPDSWAIYQMDCPRAMDPGKPCGPWLAGTLHSPWKPREPEPSWWGAELARWQERRQDWWNPAWFSLEFCPNRTLSANESANSDDKLLSWNFSSQLLS